MLMRTALAVAAALCVSQARAESLMLEYYAMLSPADTYNSRGESLTDFCAVVQQDRANIHRFGNPDGETADGFFNTPERRAMIAGRCDYAREHHTVANIRSRYNGFVWVRVFGTGGTVTRVQILEAAG